MSRRNLQAPTNGFLIYKPSEASASIIHLYCESVLPLGLVCLYRKISGIPGTAGFSEDRTGRIPAESPTRTSAVKLVIGIPWQREDADAGERVVLLLMIFQNQHGTRGTASGARRE